MLQLKWFYFLQGAFACDMILLYMMNTSSYYREKKFEIINFKYGQMCLWTTWWILLSKNVNQSLSYSPLFIFHSFNRRDKTKEGKERHKKDRTSRKPASEKGANHSSSQPTETEHLSSGVTESLPPVDKRGPTIPRNTGQRYSALSHQGAEPKPHITFSSLN